MIVPSTDERTILTVFAEASVPLDWGDVVESLLPPRPRWPRRGGKRAWMRHCEALVRATMTLYKAGLLAEVPTGPADMTMITDAGREALWGPRPSGWIRTDATLTSEQVEAWRRRWDDHLEDRPTVYAYSVPTQGAELPGRLDLRPAGGPLIAYGADGRAEVVPEPDGAAETPAQPPSGPGEPSAPSEPS